MIKRGLYIHVGPHKTGTTSIQRGLVANKDQLEKLGYHYPEVCYIYDGHHNLVFDLSEMDKFVPMLGGLNELVDFANNSVGHIILSSEAFDNIVTPEPLEKLKKALGKTFDIHIIGYLRPQDELLQSLWKTNVRFQGVLENFDVWLPQAIKDLPFLKYDEWLQNFINVFGRKNVHFDIYNPSSDDLLFSFLNICGIEDVTALTLPERENVSLKSFTFEVTRRLYIEPYILRRRDANGNIPILKSTYANVSRVVEKFAAEEDIDMSLSCYTKDMLRPLRERFRPHNQKAARVYFDRPRLFLSGKRLKPAPSKLIDLLTPEQALRLGGRLIEMEQARARKEAKPKGKNKT